MPTTQDELDRKQLLYSFLIPVMNMYSQILCGLMREQVLRLVAIFSFGLLRAIYFL
uniref:Uncharacterized protein n=1 Tax=Solanum lycopersicum TaxID=4081 RepID=K4CEX2_SOLLC